MNEEKTTSRTRGVKVIVVTHITYEDNSPGFFSLLPFINASTTRRPSPVFLFFDGLRMRERDDRRESPTRR